MDVLRNGGLFSQGGGWVQEKIVLWKWAIQSNKQLHSEKPHKQEADIKTTGGTNSILSIKDETSICQSSNADSHLLTLSLQQTVRVNTKLGHFTDQCGGNKRVRHLTDLQPSQLL